MKTKYFESKAGTLICALTGAEYQYSVSDKASRQSAVEKLAAHQSTELERMRQTQPGLTEHQHFAPTRVPHPETRTPQELKAKRLAAMPKQPSGIPDKPVNPFDGAFQRKADRLGYSWGQSPAGREARAELKKLSKEWEAEQERKQQQTEFVESVRPAVDHATKVFNELQRDPSITVAELEQAQARVQLARDGHLADYAVADREWRETQTRKLEDAAVEVDSRIRTLAAKRDTILQAAYEPVNEAVEPQLVPVFYPDFYHDPAKAGKTIMEPMPQ